MIKQAINRINPDKLMLSKWTSLTPVNKEKHFLVTQVEKDDQNVVISCTLEAILTHQEYSINWQELKEKVALVSRMALNMNGL